MAAERSVVVTGAAGAIGAATVEALLAAGMAVIGLDRQPAAERDGGRHRHALADLTDPPAVAAALDAACADAPPVAHLVGIAGGALPEEPRTQNDPVALSPALFAASLEANLTSQYIALHALLPRLGDLAGEDRSVTFTSSFNGLSAQGMPAYSAAKAGLTGLMHGLVRPLGAEGIRVNVVAPGTVRTPRTERLWGEVPGHFERLVAGTALGRLAQPEDVADAFVALALSLRRVTGQVLVVDGGQTVVHR